MDRRRRMMANNVGGTFEPTFQLLFADLGAGAVSTTESKRGIAATFTRATTAWTKLSSGLWASVASGTARSFYAGFTTAVGSYLGYLAEGARTNLCLQARDTSNASWTKVNMTAAKDQVGIDGSANSASSLTATAINGSCLQTITEAATLSAFSVFIKRITGTGTVTIQQGASTSEISAQLNSSTYTRVELDASVLNPAIGIVLGTSGDKIAVDMFQFENGAAAGTPIPTTTISVTRNADTLTYPSAGVVLAGVGTLYEEHTIVSSSVLASATFACIDDGTANNKIDSRQGSGTPTSWIGEVLDATVAQSSVAVAGVVVNTAYKAVFAWAANDMAGVLNGTLSTDVAGTIPVGLTTIRIGTTASATQPFAGIKSVRLYSTRLPNAVLQQLAT